MLAITDRPWPNPYHNAHPSERSNARFLPDRRVLRRVLSRVLRSLTWENPAQAPAPPGHVLGGPLPLAHVGHKPPWLPPTVTYRGKGRHSTTHTPPDPTQIGPTRGQDTDGHADISRPPRRQGPASTGITPLPQKGPAHPQDGPAATGRQTSELRSRRSARLHQTTVTGPSPGAATQVHTEGRPAYSPAYSAYSPAYSAAYSGR